MARIELLEGRGSTQNIEILYHGRVVTIAQLTIEDTRYLESTIEEPVSSEEYAGTHAATIVDTGDHKEIRLTVGIEEADAPATVSVPVTDDEMSHLRETINAPQPFDGAPKPFR